MEINQRHIKMTMITSTKIFETFTCIYPLRYLIKRYNAGTTIFPCKGTCTSMMLTRSFKSSVQLLSEGKFTRDPSRIVKRDGTTVRKKTQPNVMINLVNDLEITILSLKAAETIAKAKGLNLVKIPSERSSVRETYKLVKDSDLGNEIKQIESGSSTNLKTFIFTSTILDNDLQVKTKSLLKHLQKKKKLKCIIKKLGYPAQAETIFDKIKEELKKSEMSFKIISIASSNTVIQFRIEPNLD